MVPGVGTGYVILSTLLSGLVQSAKSPQIVMVTSGFWVIFSPRFLNYSAKGFSFKRKPLLVIIVIINAQQVIFRHCRLFLRFR